MELFCRLLLFFLLGMSFVETINRDINGKEAKEPLGVPGVIITIVVFAAYVALIFGANL